jgi:hexosaminidase
MMLDVSRHFMSKDSVKKVIDILAMHKLNKFHWHLVDGIGWRIQIDKYPELTRRGAWRKVKKGLKPWEDYESCYADAPGEVYGGFYTKDDIREIVQYAAERYIDVIPEIEMPGHSEAALQCYPNLICEDATNTGVYCAGKDASFTFLQAILDEVVELFPYDYLHIGGDEVGKATWLNCSLCQQRMKREGLKNGEELQSYFVKRMEEFIHSKGKKLIGWDEILEGGLPARATVMSWRGMAGGIEAANEGHDVVMSPGSPCYFDHCQGKSEYEPESWGGYNNVLKVYDFNPVPPDIAADKRHHILGGQANLWTEQIKTLRHAQYMMLPRLCALSEALWTSAEHKDSLDFIQRLDVHLDRLAEKGYHYAESAFTPNYDVSYDKINKVFRFTLYNELNLYDIHYTLDGTTPTLSSPKFMETVVFDKPIDLHAQCYRKGKAVGYPLKKSFSTQLADKCQVSYAYAYNDSYASTGERALVDNQFALNRGDDPRWQGFEGVDFDVTLDLGEMQQISRVSLNFFQHIGATSVMLPANVEISISKDGAKYQRVLKKEVETVTERAPIIKAFTATFPNQEVGFIHIKGTNRKVLPDWHIRKGPAWVFVDEISIK